MKTSLWKTHRPEPLYIYWAYMINDVLIYFFGWELREDLYLQFAREEKKRKETHHGHSLFMKIIQRVGQEDGFDRFPRKIAEKEPNCKLK